MYIFDFSHLFIALKNSSLQIGIGICITGIIYFAIRAWTDSFKRSQHIITLLIGGGLLAFLLNFDAAIPVIVNIYKTLFS